MTAQVPNTAVYVVIQATDESNIDIGKLNNVWATTNPHTPILKEIFKRPNTDVYLFFTTYANIRNTQFFSGLARMCQVPCLDPYRYWSNGVFGSAFKVDWIVKNGTTPIVFKPTNGGSTFYNDAEEMPAWIARTPLHALLNNAALINPTAPLINPTAPVNVVADARAHLASIPPSTQAAPVATAPITRSLVSRPVGRQAARNIDVHFKTISHVEAMKVTEADLKTIKKTPSKEKGKPKRIVSPQAKKKARALRRKKKEARVLRRKARALRKKKKKAGAHRKKMAELPTKRDASEGEVDGGTSADVSQEPGLWKDNRRRRDGGRPVNLDQYFTKVSVVQDLVTLMHEKYFVGKPHKFVDSSCGSGSVVGALRDLGHQTWAFDVDVSHAPESVGAVKADWLSLKIGEIPFPKDTCVGFNPPFGFCASDARKFVTQAAVLAPSAPFLFFIAPRSLVYGVARGAKWAPRGFRVVGEHKLDDNAFFTPRDGKDFHTDSFFFVFSPGEETSPERTTTTADGVKIQSIPVKTGKNTGRVPLNEILSGGRRQMLVRRIGVNAGHDFVFRTARKKRFLQVTVGANGLVNRKKQHARDASWSLSQHNILTFARVVNRFAVARHIGKMAHAHRAKIGGRCITREFLSTALQDFLETV